MLKLLGHIVDDGEGLWMISSAAEIGFRVTGATRVKLELLADDTVLDPEKEAYLPRFEIRLNGERIIDTRLTAKEEAVTVFDGTEKRDAEIREIAEELAREIRSLKISHAAMGGEGSIARMQQKKQANLDYTHINAAGGKVLAQSLFDALTH